MEKIRISAQYALYQGDLETYFRRLEEIISKYPQDKDTHYWLGFYLVQPGTGSLRDVERGIKELETVLALDPYHADALNSLGSIHSQLGNLDKAEAYYKKYASLSPDNANPFDSLGNFYFRRRAELDAAIAAYESLVTFDPKSQDRRFIHPLNYYRLAKVYEQKGIFKKAKANYRKFLKLWENADSGLHEVEDAKKRLAAID